MTDHPGATPEQIREVFLMLQAQDRGRVQTGILRRLSHARAYHASYALDPDQELLIRGRVEDIVKSEIARP